MIVDKNSVLVQLAESDRTEFGRVKFSGQAEEQKVFSAVFGLEGEVNSGGFEQYFVSANGESANFAPVALRTIGAHAAAEIVEQALKAVSRTALPEDQSAREDLVDGLSDRGLDKLGELDTDFLTYPDDLTGLLFEFVRARAGVFGPVG